jgi:Histidine kinase-, DNA gyrase B-, and HSP90-like ATPase
MKDNITSVNIRPGVGFLSLLPHLNYKPWFALAEFVDNSLQSFLSYHDELEQIEGKGCKLKVQIEIDSIDGGRIIIRDNAAGIHQNDYPRAFRPAALPPDRSGLSEFGIGMKSAACWFADFWTVRTSALGEDVERTIAFDTKAIVRDNLEDVIVREQPSLPNTHYTEIILTKLEKLPKGKTISKIKEHLASIYRVFIRENMLELRFEDEPLLYPEPKVLVAPFYRTPDAEAQIWRKNIEFDFGLGLRAYGFAALRETGSTSNAGFSLFRRNRLIEGSGDETYRPEYIFERPNSFTYQRLFGELHLEGFEVSHTKDGFQWDEHEEIFLEFLKDELDSDPLPLRGQAEGYRVRPKSKELKSGVEAATERTAEVIKHEVPQVLQVQLDTPPVNTDPSPTLPPIQTLSQRVIDIELEGCKWQIFLELSNDPSIGDWVDLCDQLITSEPVVDSNVRQVGIRLALAHPFMERFGGVESSRIEPLLRIAVAIVLAEVTARSSGVRQAGALRRNINELLRTALSKP